MLTAGSIELEELKQILLQAGLPGVAERMNAWCVNEGIDRPWAEWMEKVDLAGK